jgi:NTE family protein
MEQPIERQTATTSQSRTFDRASLPGQVVLVLQGGGALGSYQAGVYQALQEARIEPDWIVGTSIGAINASLIAGNAPQDRLARLIEFWSRVRRAPQLDFRGVLPGFSDRLSYWTTLTRGIPGFFTPILPVRRRSSRLLLDGAARSDSRRARRLRSDQQGKSAPHGRGGARAHQPDDVFR